MPSPVLSFILSNRALIADGLKAVRDWPKGRSQGGSMSEHVYKQIELTGSSKTGVEAAVQNAIAKASKTLHNLHWFQVVETDADCEGSSMPSQSRSEPQLRPRFWKNLSVRSVCRRVRS